MFLCSSKIDLKIYPVSFPCGLLHDTISHLKKIIKLNFSEQIRMNITNLVTIQHNNLKLSKVGCLMYILIQREYAYS